MLAHLLCLLQHLITSVRLSGRFQEEFDVRLLRHMNTIFIDPMTNDDLITMSTTIMERHFSDGFVNSVAKLANVGFADSSLVGENFNKMSILSQEVSVATIELFQVWEEKEKDSVSHYSVSVSCVNRVIQGLMSVPAANLVNANKLHRLWIHETCRVWADRLMTDDDRKWFLLHVDRIGVAHFKQSLDKYLFASAMGGADYRILPKIHFSKLQSLTAPEIICDEARPSSLHRISCI